jgi:hypothetical protein
VSIFSGEDQGGLRRFKGTTPIANHSVMSWAHINMLGEYDFSDEKLQDSFGIRPPKLVTQARVKNGRNETPVK